MTAASGTSASVPDARMATAVSSRPSAPLQNKLKRPPPPNVQTSFANAPSQSSPSPSTANKRPGAGPAVPGSAGVNGPSSATSAAPGARLGTRRRDSAKVGGTLTRQTTGLRSGGMESPSDKRVKRPPEPFVRTTAYILKKYNKSPPSFVLHLHATHFRFDEQDGSFSYNSPMRILLDHIKEQTVPHDMLDELLAAGIKFYEDCLIVQVQDHRNTTKTKSTSSSTATDSNQPFSIHNYNEHVTPSPFVPYPHSKPTESKASETEGAGKDQESDTPKKPDAVESQPTAPEGPKVFTTVLFPTALCLQEELLRFASLPDNRFNKNKQTQPNGRAPGSAGMPQTPTSTAGTGPATMGPPAKKQKMMFGYNALADIESKMISAKAPPLFLEPAKDFYEAQSLIEELADPRSLHTPPAPKSRKRTVAELAADEAMAAEQQRYMLIMDERNIPSTNAAAGGQAATASGEEAGTGFEARFERFKAIEEIRTMLEEKRQREAEAKAQQQQLALQQQAQEKAKREQEELEARQQQAHEQKMREAANRRAELLRMQQMSHQNAQSNKPNGIPQNFAVTQAVQSSPVARTHTPHGPQGNASSPPLVNAAMNKPLGAPAMSISNSNQSHGSPQRPGSAMQNIGPGAAMAAQRNQAASRVGTPGMANQTPQQSRATPVMANATSTPTPRMPQRSPVNAQMSPSVMNRPMQSQTPMSGHPMTQQQQAAYHQHQVQQRVLQQAQAQANAQRQQQHIQQQNIQQQMAAQRAGTEMNYRQQLQNLQQQQMGAMQAQGQQFNVNMSPTQQQQGAQQARGPPQSQAQRMFQFFIHREVEQLKQQAIAKFGPGPIPPNVVNQIKELATQRATQAMKNENEQRQLMRQMQMQQMQQMQQAGMMNNMNMGGMNGTMGGMNGMGGGGMGNM